MEDDLNTPDALAAVFEFVKDINTLSAAADKASLQAAAAMFDELTGVLGLLYNRKTAEAPDEVKALVEQRAAAKKAKDFAKADAAARADRRAGLDRDRHGPGPAAQQAITPYRQGGAPACFDFLQEDCA